MRFFMNASAGIERTSSSSSFSEDNHHNTSKDKKKSPILELGLKFFEEIKNAHLIHSERHIIR